MGFFSRHRSPVQSEKSGHVIPISSNQTPLCGSAKHSFVFLIHGCCFFEPILTRETMLTFSNLISELFCKPCGLLKLKVIFCKVVSCLFCFKMFFIFEFAKLEVVIAVILYNKYLHLYVYFRMF